MTNENNQPSEVTTMQIYIKIGGAEPPEGFAQDFLAAMGELIKGIKTIYNLKTGNTLEILPPDMETIKKLMGEGAELVADASLDEEIDADQYEEGVTAMMRVTGISRERAEAIIESGEIPEDVKAMILDHMVEAGHFEREQAERQLASGLIKDRWGATEGCDCEGCKAKRAQVDELRARFAAARLN